MNKKGYIFLFWKKYWENNFFGENFKGENEDNNFTV